MSKHIVLKILNDLDIRNERDIQSRIISLEQDDFEILFQEINSWYETHQLELITRKIGGESIFDFWIPTIPSQEINKLTSNLLLADSVILSDPLYDHFYMVAEEFYRGIGDELGKMKQSHYCPSCKEQLDSHYQSMLRKRIENILAFYLRAAPLIESNKIIPFVDTTPKSRLIFDAPFEKVLLPYDKEYRNWYAKSENFQQIIGRAASKYKHVVNDVSIPIFEELLDLTTEKILMLDGLNEIFFGNSVNSPSIDFLGHVSGHTFKALYNFLIKNAKEQMQQQLPVSLSGNHFSVPTLLGIPVQEIPEILVKEKDTLSQFKFSLNSRISSISEPFGTPLWEKQLDSVRAGLKKEIIEIEKNLLHIKKDHLRRQASNVTFLFFSLSLASLALLHQNIDPISAIQGVASGAGLTSSIKGMIDAWLDYRKDVDEQKRRDVYFLWELRNRTKAG